jgi:segregation and condensation protein A
LLAPDSPLELTQIPTKTASSVSHAPMKFRVDLDTFRGPMDLLLYLVRKHEVDVVDLPIALVTDQYLQYLTVLEQLDVNAVGDFLEMASTLIEIKSRLVLPRADEIEDEIEDPRAELVQRLLEYKKYKDAASILEERSRQWQQHYPRAADDLRTRRVDPAEQPIHEVELWDLVSAMGRVMRENLATKPSNIVYDETPIHVYMEVIHGRLVRDGRVAFSEMFELGMHKSAMIGVFLAILELVRHRHVLAEQNRLHGEIWILPSDGFSKTFDASSIDQYDHGPEEDDEVLTANSE